MPAFEDKLTPEQRWEVGRLHPHVCDEAAPVHLLRPSRQLLAKKSRVKSPHRFAFVELKLLYVCERVGDFLQVRAPWEYHNSWTTPLFPARLMMKMARPVIPFSAM